METIAGVMKEAALAAGIEKPRVAPTELLSRRLKPYLPPILTSIPAAKAAFGIDPDFDLALQPLQLLC
jgi:hypothetical protein